MLKLNIENKELRSFTEKNHKKSQKIKKILQVLFIPGLPKSTSSMKLLPLPDCIAYVII